MKPIVALDLETTGLDSQSDAIIEIGAVRFDGNRIENELSLLINPGRHIPEFITGLTGINDSMVRDAPHIREVLPELAEFIRDSPILGHNIKFDLSFLHKFKLFEFNDSIDTYELAAVLMPSASRYNLGALGKQLGIPLPATHRALDDARVTAAAYQKLYVQAMELPIELLTEIVENCEAIEWDGSWAFTQALRARSLDGVKSQHCEGETSFHSAFFEEGRQAKVSSPSNSS